MLKKIFLSICGLFALAIIWLIIVLAFPFSHCLFDKEEWRDTKIMSDRDLIANKSEPRKCMVTHLISRYLKKGMHENKVVELLGEESRKVLYAPEDLQEVVNTDLPYSIAKELELVLRSKQPFYTVEVLVAPQGHPTHIERSYDIGQFLIDYCMLKITFDKNGYLTDTRYFCS